MLAQLTSGEIQFENSKMERPAQLMVFLQEEANLSGKECTTGQSLMKHKAGTPSRKSCIKSDLPGELHSSRKELPVHCIDFKCDQ